MKIVFLEPASPGLHVYKRTALPRMGSLYLATILKNAGHDVRVYVEDIRRPDPRVLAEADLVGISTISATAPRAYEYARWLRRHGVKTVIGGSHVTFLPEEALRHADVVAIGEAENSILPLVEAIRTGRDLSEVPGIAYLENGEMRMTPPAPAVTNLDELPSVDFSLLQGELTKAFTQVVLPAITSRGCPYACNFCSVAVMFGRKYRFRSPEKVIEDLRSAPGISDKHVFFYDDHFAAHKGRVRELMERLIREKLGFTFSAQVRADVGKDASLLREMKKGGLETVYVGFESINPDTLKSYNKGQTVEEMTESIRGFHQAGIRVHGMFVFGSDEDTPETIRETVRFAKRNRIESVQFLILTPLPGTEFYERMLAQDRVAADYWALFDGHHVTFEPKRMSPYELQHGTFKAMRDFYSFWECAKPLLRFNAFDAMVRFYGRNLVRAWTRSHRHYIDEFRDSWRNALVKLELEWESRLHELAGPGFSISRLLP